MSIANATEPLVTHTQDMAILWLERTEFVGSILGGVGYGVHAVVAFLCLSSLWPKASFTNRRSMLQLAFICFLFVMGTINFSCNTALHERRYVENRLYPGGPIAYSATHFAVAEYQIGNGAYVVANILTDATLLWRTFIIWNKSYLILAVPFLLYLVSTTMSILLMYRIAHPMAHLWTYASPKFNFMLAYFSMSLTLNLLLTLLIAGRLLSMHSRVKNHLGSHHARTYTSVAAMMVESALPYSVLSLAFIISLAVNSPAHNLIISPLSQAMCMSPELIVWRVATGRAWAENTTGVTYSTKGAPTGSRPAGESEFKLSQLKFKTQDTSGTYINNSHSHGSFSKPEEIA